MTRYGFTYPTRVARLVLVEPGPPRREPYSRMFNAALAARIDSATGVRLSRLQQALDTASDQISVCREIFGLLAVAYWGDVADAAKAKGHPCTTADWMRNFVHVNDAMLASVGAYDWRARLADVKSPVLVIHGTRDPIPLDAAREWAAGFGDARLLTIEGSGHFPWEERPTTFFSAVESFLDGSWPKGAHSVPGK